MNRKSFAILAALLISATAFAAERYEVTLESEAI